MRMMMVWATTLLLVAAAWPTGAPAEGAEPEPIEIPLRVALTT